MRGRKKIYATPEDRHRAYRARLGMTVKKPVVLANGIVRKVEKTARIVAATDHLGQGATTVRVIPDWLKESFDSELGQHTELTSGQREAVQADSYMAVQRYIDTHQPGPYPAWGDHSKDVMARNFVRHAIQRVVYGQ